MTLFQRLARWFNPPTYPISAVTASLPDDRDYIFAPSGQAIPSRQDLRPDASAVEEQLYIGSCTGQSVIGGCELLKWRDGFKVELSRLFNYYTSRESEGRIGQEGAQLRSALKTAQKVGIPPEFLWPYDPSKADVRPPDAAYTFARPLNRYERITLRNWDGATNAANIKAAIAEGLPVVFAMPVTTDLFNVSGALDKQFYRGYGFPGTEIAGNHAMVVVGFDDVLGGLIVRNSWGSGWGDGGYFLLSYGQCDCIFEAWAIRGFDGCEVVRFTDDQVKQAIRAVLADNWTGQRILDAAIDLGISFRQLCRCFGVSEDVGREAIKGLSFPEWWCK